MAETALTFGPEWLRALSHGNSASSPPSSPSSSGIPKYKLAEFRYGREEMLALFPKDAKMPEELVEFPYISIEKCQIPLTLIPVSEEEQRILASSVNSEVGMRLGKGSGNLNSNPGIIRGGRGGSVDRGRGRGRGNYYRGGMNYEDGEDGIGSFKRVRQLDRSHSVNERDQQWEERERRYERSYSGRSIEESRKDTSRIPNDNWRRSNRDHDRPGDDDGDWRHNTRGSDSWSNRGSWRNHEDRTRDKERDRDKENYDKSNNINNDDYKSNSSNRSAHHNSSQKSDIQYWDDEFDSTGDQLPEWSTEDSSEADQVGTFDASGAFMENKVENSVSSNERVQNNADNELNERNKKEIKVNVKLNVQNIVRQPLQTKTNIVQTLNEKENSSRNIERNCEIQSDSDTNFSEKNSKTTEKTNECVIPEEPPKHPSFQPPSLQTPLENCQINERTNVQVPNNMLRSSSLHEEDSFAHLTKATENMMAEWTAEEEQRISSHRAEASSVLPLHHENAYKWFYRDPQGDVQGPFSPQEMMEWFKSGYFTMNLLIRRGCDERFLQLGDLLKLWNQVPFAPGINPSPPPIRLAPGNVSATTLPQANVPPSPPIPQQSKDDIRQITMIQQQMFHQQFMQQQMMIRQQTQLYQLFNQLKQQEQFVNLSDQQQQQVLMHHFHQQQISGMQGAPMVEQPNLIDPSAATPPAPLPLSLLGFTIPPMLKNGPPLWGIPPGTGAWPVDMNAPQVPGGSIWDIDQNATENGITSEEVLQKEEKRRKELEEEERRKQEQQKLEIAKRVQEEEERRKEEMKRMEEMKRREQERKLEEERQRNELRRQEELRMQEQERKRQEEQRQIQEMMRIEEERKLQEEKRREEEARRQEIEKELRRQEMEKERRLRQEELEKQRLKELEWQLEKQKEIELQQMLEQQARERQKQMELEAKCREAAARKAQQAAAWGSSQPISESGTISLNEIQRIQEEKERKEKEEQLMQLHHQQTVRQAQQNKSALTWAQRSTNSTAPVKSLIEIQKEEVEILAKQQKVPNPQINISAASTVWGNPINNGLRIPSINSWGSNDINSSSGFWDDVVSISNVQKSAKKNDSAFPALRNVDQPSGSNKSKMDQKKKEQDSVMRLFETHTKQNSKDEFTKWCTDALSSLPSSVDVPTFVAFLKDVESPYEVHDYVRSYFGEDKEVRDFAKEFLERRNKYYQFKQNPLQDIPRSAVPANNSIFKKSVEIQQNIPQHYVVDNDPQGKGKKKKKNRMQKLDSSLLGFTVQHDPDRINVGEIDRVEGM